MSKRLETTLFGLVGTALGTGSVILFGFMRGWPIDELASAGCWSAGGGILYVCCTYTYLLYKDLTRSIK